MTPLARAPRSRFALALLVPLLASCAHTGSKSTERQNGGEPPRASEPITVTAEELQRDRSKPIEEVLMSRVAGLNITRAPDGTIAIRIRGRTSIHGSTEPLFVIDGMPIQAGPGGSLAGINPYDIESIQVLRDATDISMYGLRGANGVIVIQTRRPGSDR